MVKKIIILLSFLCVSKFSYSMSGFYPSSAVIAEFLEKEFNAQNKIPNIEEFFKQRVESLLETIYECRFSFKLYQWELIIN